MRSSASWAARLWRSTSSRALLARSAAAARFLLTCARSLSACLSCASRRPTSDVAEESSPFSRATSPFTRALSSRASESSRSASAMASPAFASASSSSGTASRSARILRLRSSAPCSAPADVPTVVRPSGSTVTPCGVTYVNAGAFACASTASRTPSTSLTSPSRASTRLRAPSLTVSDSATPLPGAPDASAPPGAASSDTIVATPFALLPSASSTRPTTPSASRATSAERSSPRRDSTTPSSSAGASNRSATRHSIASGLAFASAATRALAFCVWRSTASSAESVAFEEDSLPLASPSADRALDAASLHSRMRRETPSSRSRASASAFSVLSRSARLLSSASSAVWAPSSICFRRLWNIWSSTSAFEIWSRSFANASVSASAVRCDARTSPVSCATRLPSWRLRSAASRAAGPSSLTRLCRSSASTRASEYSPSTRSCSSAASRDWRSMADRFMRISERRSTMFLPFSSRRRMSESMRPSRSCMRRRCSPRSPTKMPFCSRRDWYFSRSRFFSSRRYCASSMAASASLPRAASVP